MKPLTPEQKRAISLRIDGLTRYEGECQVWVGYIQPPDKTGRPRRPRLRIRMNGKRHLIDARLLRWTSVHGAPPKGRVVRLTCGNPLCMQVEHMRLGTKSEVLAESYRLHEAKTRIARALGNRKTRGKLTLEIARAIRASDAKNVELARLYGVSHQLIYAVRKGLSWPDYGLLGVSA